MWVNDRIKNHAKSFVSHKYLTNSYKSHEKNTYIHIVETRNQQFIETVLPSDIIEFIDSLEP